MVRYSFPVGLLHPRLPAGLSRRFRSVRELPRTAPNCRVDCLLNTGSGAVRSLKMSGRSSGRAQWVGDRSRLVREATQHRREGFRHKTCQVPCSRQNLLMRSDRVVLVGRQRAVWIADGVKPPFVTRLGSSVAEVSVTSLFKHLCALVGFVLGPAEKPGCKAGNDGEDEPSSKERRMPRWVLPFHPCWPEQEEAERECGG